MKTCGEGAIAGLHDGQVVLVTASATPYPYGLDCDKPLTGAVWGLEVSQDCKMPKPAVAPPKKFCNSRKKAKEVMEFEEEKS